MLAGMGQDERGRPRLALDDEPRVMALLATAYEGPVEPYVLTKMCRAAELWNEGGKRSPYSSLFRASAALRRRAGVAPFRRGRTHRSRRYTKDADEGARF